MSARTSSRLNVLNVRSFLVLLVGLGGIPYASLIGQTREFEAVSIKPVDHGVPEHSTGGPGTSDPGRLMITRISVKDLIAWAYAPEYRDRIVGPDLLNAEYSVAATMAPTTTEKELREMLATLLKGRFALRFHEEQRRVSVYSLTTASGGSMPKADNGDLPTVPVDEASVRRSPIILDSNGYPTVPPGYKWVVGSDSNGMSKYAFRGCSMAELAGMLSFVFTHSDTPVLDETGLSGRYTFHLDLPSVARRPPASLGAQAPAELGGDISLGAVSRFLEKQVGLRLIASKPLFRFMIVDHVAKQPTDN
jgi:uncharacterized protein (TIGR03435 family)